MIKANLGPQCGRLMEAKSVANTLLTADKPAPDGIFDGLPKCGRSHQTVEE